MVPWVESAPLERKAILVSPEGCSERPAQRKANDCRRSSARSSDPHETGVLSWPPRVSDMVAVVAALISVYCVVLREWPLVASVSLLIALLAVNSERIIRLRALLPGGAEVEAVMTPMVGADVCGTKPTESPAAAWEEDGDADPGQLNLPPSD